MLGQISLGLKTVEWNKVYNKLSLKYGKNAMTHLKLQWLHVNGLTSV